MGMEEVVLTDGGCIVEGCQGCGRGDGSVPTPEGDALDGVVGVDAVLNNGVHQVVPVDLLLLSLALAAGLCVACKAHSVVAAP